MSEELNPYAPPVIPDELPFDPNGECVLEYENTAARQWAAAMVLADKSPLVKLALVGFGGVCFLIYMVVSLATEADAPNKLAALMLAALPVVAVAAYFVLIRVLAYTEISRFRANAVVGSLGPWQVTINQQQLTIRSYGGEQSWPLRPMCYVVNDIKPPILWLEPRLPIQLPYAPLSRTPEAQQAHALLFEFAKNER